MSLLPNAEQRRADRRWPLPKIIGVGLVVAIAVYLAGLFHGDGDILGAVSVAVGYIVVVGLTSLVLRSKDRRQT